MKYMIASDLHGSAFYVKQLMLRYIEEKPDQVLILGDILYHGPRNPLPDEYETKETAAMLNEFAGKVLAVRGNCDAEVDQVMVEFPIFEENRTLEVEGHTIFMTHGHHYGPSYVPPVLGEGDIILTGHTHVPAWEKLPGGVRYFNPGSVSIPKGGSEHSYMIINGKDVAWKNLEGKVYHTETL